MTAEEFAKATGKTVEQVRQKYNKTAKGNAAGNAMEYESGEPILTGHVDFSEKNSVMDALKEAENEFPGLPYEANRSVTTDGNIWTIYGNKGFVETSKIETQEGGSSLKGSYSYHNHLKTETHFSFGGEDIAFFLEYEQEYSVASDHKYRYFVKRTPETQKAKYEDIVAEFGEIERTEIYEKAFNGEIDIDENGYHEIVKMLSNKYKFTYKRVKKDG